MVLLAISTSACYSLAIRSFLFLSKSILFDLFTNFILSCLAFSMSASIFADGLSPSTTLSSFFAFLLSAPAFVLAIATICLSTCSIFLPFPDLASSLSLLISLSFQIKASVNYMSTLRRTRTVFDETSVQLYIS